MIIIAGLNQPINYSSIFGCKLVFVIIQNERRQDII